MHFCQCVGACARERKSTPERTFIYATKSPIKFQFGGASGNLIAIAAGLLQIFSAARVPKFYSPKEEREETESAQQDAMLARATYWVGNILEACSSWLQWA